MNRQQHPAHPSDRLEFDHVVDPLGRFIERVACPRHLVRQPLEQPVAAIHDQHTVAFALSCSQEIPRWSIRPFRMARLVLMWQAPV